MIIRNNLALSPMRNYSLYLIGCLILAIATIGFTVFNIAGLSRSLIQSRALKGRIAAEQLTMDQLQQQANGYRRQIDQIKTPQFIAETQFINDAIKRRVFSWTKLFDVFEHILPENVKMVSVSPTIKEDEININLEVAGQNLKDVLNFILILENSPAFSKVYFKSERHEQDGQIYATISLRYLPEKAADVTQISAQSQTAAAEEDNQEEEQ